MYTNGEKPKDKRSKNGKTCFDIHNSYARNVKMDYHTERDNYTSGKRCYGCNSTEHLLETVP